MAEPAPKWSKRKLVAVCVTGSIASVVVLSVLFVTVWFRSWLVPSQAMEPTVHAGSHVWSRSIDGSRVHRDDIVIIVPPKKTQTVITRVVAVGGDSIESTNGHVLLNGASLDEPFIRHGQATPPFASTIVPNGTIFVLGDNRTDSVGSPVYGPVPVANVEALVVKTDAPALIWLWLLAVLSLVPLLIALLSGHVFGRGRY